MLLTDDERARDMRSASLAGRSRLDLGYGRFVETDPLGYADGLNWYNYVGGDPVNATDPDGLDIVVTGNRCAADAHCYSSIDPNNRGAFIVHIPDLAPIDNVHDGDILVVNDKPQNKQCGPTSMFPHGGGLSVGASADAGIPGAAGAGANGSVGAGGFYSGNAGFSAGAFASGGAAAYAGSHSGSAVGGSSPTFAGASAGIGVSGFITNAQSVQQLAGPFTTYSVNVGFGPLQGTISLSLGGGIYQLSVSPPGAGLSAGGSLSRLQTTTVATDGCK